MNEKTEKKIKVLIGIAPKGTKVRDIIFTLGLDPYQSRVSQHPIILTHPRKGTSKVLSEYVEDLLGDSRFAVETDDGLVFISRVVNSALGEVFIPTAVAQGKEVKLLGQTFSKQDK